MSFVRLMLPTDVNFAGNVFGGVVLRQIDEIAYAVSSRHAQCNVVTASVDRMDFLAPLHLGDVARFEGQLTYVGHASMEVWIRILAEDLYGSHSREVGNCYVTMVALDRDGHPTPAPPLQPATSEEQRLFKEGEARAASRRSSRARPGEGS